MLVVTWNVNSIRSRLDHLLRWVETAKPDVICLQETKTIDDKFPAAEIAAAGYPHQAIDGQKAYNGVAILSRHPIDNVHNGFTVGDADPQKRLIRARVEGVTVVNCYVPNGESVGTEKFRYKLAWLERLREDLGAYAPEESLLVCGDFNIAPGDLDLFDPFEREGKLLAHPAERNALQDVLDLGLADAYRVNHPMGTQYSWWDYRGMAFRYNRGIRIDLILLSDPLMKGCKKVELWRDVRGWDKPSDHIPVGAHL
jgi:exodeoxyribonuclease III